MPRSARRWPGTRRCVPRAPSENASQKRLATLTERERQVLEQIVAGRLNKQIAAELGTVEKTIKFHRGNLMRKMGVRVVADLVKLAERAGVGSNAQNLRQRHLDTPDTWTKVQLDRPAALDTVRSR